jgi:hypothetical protein
MRLPCVERENCLHISRSAIESPSKLTVVVDSRASGIGKISVNEIVLDYPDTKAAEHARKLIEQ